MTRTDLMLRDASDPIPFGQTFVSSEAFRALFREGMSLVEETAAYLDEAGREDSRRLDRMAALSYASESMRLTTRLMQIASWLLVHRAVAEGEITPSQARQEKTRVRLTTVEPGGARSDVEALPARLRDLIGLSLRLHARLLHLDALVSGEAGDHAATPVADQHRLLRRAFGA